jgi:hypothetical protein
LAMQIGGPAKLAVRTSKRPPIATFSQVIESGH